MKCCQYLINEEIKSNCGKITKIPKICENIETFAYRICSSSHLGLKSSEEIRGKKQQKKKKSKSETMRKPKVDGGNDNNNNSKRIEAYKSIVSDDDGFAVPQLPDGGRHFYVKKSVPVAITSQTLLSTYINVNTPVVSTAVLSNPLYIRPVSSGMIGNETIQQNGVVGGLYASDESHEDGSILIMPHIHHSSISPNSSKRRKKSKRPSKSSTLTLSDVAPVLVRSECSSLSQRIINSSANKLSAPSSFSFPEIIKNLTPSTTFRSSAITSRSNSSDRVPLNGEMTFKSSFLDKSGVFSLSDSNNNKNIKNSEVNSSEAAEQEKTLKRNSVDETFSPPPKKKWIQHYLMANSSSNGIGTSSTNSNSNQQFVLSSSIEDSSQSSLNFSSNGYLSGGNNSINSNIGNVAGAGAGSTSGVNSTPSGGISILNSTNSSSSSSNNLNGNSSSVNLTHSPSGMLMNSLYNDGDHPMQTAQPTTPMPTSGRRRTTSTNSNGAGTREVHNQLEKHRRALLKECFEQLKVQLETKDEEKKKTSNLAILGSAYRCVMQLKRKERELEQEVEQLAKDKIIYQKRILTLKRELSSRFDSNDIANIVADSDISNIPDRESSSEIISPLMASRGNIGRYSSSPLSSGPSIPSPLGCGSSIQTAVPTAMSPVISVSSSTSPNASHLKSSSPLGSSMPLSLTTKNLSSSNLTRGSPTLSIPSPSLVHSSPAISSSSSLSLLTSVSPTSSQIGVTQSTLSSHNPSTTIGIKIPNVPNGVKLTTASPPTVGFGSISSSNTPTPVSNRSPSEGNSVVVPSSTILTSSGIPININGSSGISVLSAAKDLSGKNGICRKTPETRDSSPSSMLLAAGTTTTSTTSLGNAKELKIDKIFEGSEQPTKVIKLLNGIALAPVDKDSKILSTPLALSQMVGSGGLVVSPFPMITSSQGLRVLGQASNGLATIELSNSAGKRSSVHVTHFSSHQTPIPVQQQHSRNHQQSASSQPVSASVASTSGAQLHKLLVSGGGGTTSTAITSSGSTTPITQANSTGTSELARLPGGAELNILPTGANGTTTLYRGSGKLAIVNNGITLKEAPGAPGRAVHVVTPIQSGTTPISGLTPITGNNIAHLIASSSQLAGKVNLSVGAPALPLISPQYLSPMKPMVVAVASNTTPTLSSVPPTSTSATATASANGGS